MARKIYLVPADQYHDMLSSASAEAESPLLKHTKQEMDSLLKGAMPPQSVRLSSKRPRHKSTAKRGKPTVKKVKPTARRKRGKSMNISVRKALYDQALHRYLGQRKELKERPMKVEVVKKGGAKYMVKPKSTGDTSLISVSPQAADAMHLNTSSPLRPPPTAPFTTLSSGEESVASVQGRSPEEMKPTPTARKPVSQRKSKRTEKQRVKQELTAANREEFERQVWERRKELGIDENGAVLGAGGKAVAGSDYKKVLQYMFSPAKQPDPKGIVMRHKIINHSELGPVYKSLLSGVGTPQSGSGGGKFRPAKWI